MGTGQPVAPVFHTIQWARFRALTFSKLLPDGDLLFPGRKKGEAAAAGVLFQQPPGPHASNCSWPSELPGAPSPGSRKLPASTGPAGILPVSLWGQPGLVFSGASPKPPPGVLTGSC